MTALLLAVSVVPVGAETPGPGTQATAPSEAGKPA